MNIYRKKYESQLLKFWVFLVFAFCILHFTFINTVQAIYDPLSVPNNKYGIHLISPTDSESSPAQELINSSGGDWGYVTILIEKKDLEQVDKWQKFFNDLRRKHLVPIVRISTQPEGNFWKRPVEGDEILWANFLDKLNWPTKNRYVTIYNEPNHAKEWGNAVDAKDYARALDKTITALKNKSDDFFVLNAGFDASAPQKLPAYQDEVSFMQEMEEAVPGIFNKLDGWNSHSYPNPGFIGAPNGVGRGTVRTYFWEVQLLQSFGVYKLLPIFITETGWKHAEGLKHDSSLPDAQKVADYYKEAFETAWSSNRVAAVTPFLLSYQEEPFVHFSFKKLTGEKQNEKILGIQNPDYYPQYQVIKDLTKVSGHPIQDNKAELSNGEVYRSIVSGENYNISITFKNTGQSIWNEYEPIFLVPLSGEEELGIKPVELPKERRIEPGDEYTFTINLKAPLSGTYMVSLNLFAGNVEFSNKALEFETKVVSPVVLETSAKLKWRVDPSGEYVLTIVSQLGKIVEKIVLDTNGSSAKLEARHLLPNKDYDFILEKDYYHSRKIHKQVQTGINQLDFGELQPNLPSAILNPKVLWSLLPFSN